MKARQALRDVLVGLLALILLGSCVTTTYTPRASEEIYGTWANETSLNHDQIQKVTYSSTGFKHYSRVSDANVLEAGTWTIVGKWTDSQGNIWYKAACSYTTGWSAGMDFQALYKLSKSATVLEWVIKVTSQSQGVSYPSTIDPASDSYNIFYRQAG